MAKDRRRKPNMLSKPTMRRIWLCSVPALLTSAALLAQAPPSSGGGQQPTMPSQHSPSNSTMAQPGANPDAAPTGQNFGDQAFVSKALEGNVAEVQLGQLAEQKSQSNDVKQFAQ